MDIGCAVGRSTFELARHFQDVVGIDYSKAFIDTCNDLKMYGKLHYQVTTEGCLYSEHDAIVDEDIVSIVTHIYELLLAIAHIYIASEVLRG